MKTRGFYFGKFVVLGIAGLAVFTYVVMLFWNWLVPELFNGPEVNYWQTLGLLVLSKILFSGIGPRHRSSHAKCKDWGDHWDHNDHHPRTYWKKKFHEKMNGKTDDTQEEQSTS